MLRYDPIETLPASSGDAHVLRPGIAAQDPDVGNIFNNALAELSASGRSALMAVTPDAASDSAAGNRASPLSFLQDREQRIGAMMTRARRTQDLSLALKASAEMADQSVGFDIAAKAIGKGISAVGELTKLN